MDSYLNLGCFIRKRNLLAHLSIWFIMAIVLVISLALFKGNLFGIIYLVFFLSFVLTFQSSYSLWARLIKSYSILLIVYSTFISLSTYIYQYDGINQYFKSMLSDQVLNDIGLVVNQGWRMFIESFSPLALTMLLIVYLAVFHDDFNRFAYLAEEGDASLSAPLTGSQVSHQQLNINDSTVVVLGAPSHQERSNSRSNNVITSGSTAVASTSQNDAQPSRHPSVSNLTGSALRVDIRRSPKHASISKFCKAAVECFWRILETHFIKVVVFMIFRLPIIDVCLMNLPFLFIVIFALRCPSAAKCLCIFASWLISFIVIIRNLSNLVIFRTYDISTTCAADGPEALAGKTFSYLTYLGLNHDTGNPLNRVDNHIIVLVLITIYSFITIHYERRPVKDYELSFGVIFSGVGRREADKGIINTFKYFCNFGFYKFGVEFTCLALVIAISNRLDAIAAIYAIILTVISITTSKRTLASIWTVLSLLVTLIIPIQYVLRLGFPQALCEEYPWAIVQPDFKYWLYLSDYSAPQDATLLLLDFLVLLAVCRQAVVFKQMSRNTNQSMLNHGQTHHDLAAHLFRQRYLPNAEEFATEDCFSNYTTQSNYLKSMFFMSIYWITLAVVLVAGATKVSLFSLGYLIGCFIFLWMGNDTYLMPLKRLISSWNWFIFYATLVMFTKVVLQLYTCAFHEYLMKHCYILQLLRVVCYRKMQNIPPAIDPPSTCANSLPYDELDILWDGLCLMFLLMQRIVFGSQYFRYLVQDVKAQQILASRGAELIMATQIEEAKAQALYEKEVMRSVREKMENLKSDNEETSKAWQRLVNLPHHHQVIRNADRHLFSSSQDDLADPDRTDSSKFQRTFIPDPLGDELERMAEINGISAVFTRWMKGLPLYGNIVCQSATPPDDGAEGSSAGSRTPEEPQLLQQEPAEEPGQLARRDETLGSFDVLADDELSSDGERLKGWFDMLNLIVYSILLSATVELNKLSRSYRYVSRRMAAEKNILKRQFNLNDERFKRDSNWRKWVISTVSETYSKTSEQHQATQSNTSLHRIRSALKVIASSAAGQSSQDGSTQADPDRSHSGSPQRQQNNRTELTDPEYCFLKLNIFTQFCRALAYVFISNTSLLCQLVIIFNQMFTASLLSLPLPLLTFLWGNLSVPRPTKRFWSTVITYTESVIVIKYVCQFPIWNWDQNNISPFYYVNLFGIKNITIIYDLVLLLSLFLHRSMLKSLGQWDASADQGSLIAIDADLGDNSAEVGSSKALHGFRGAQDNLTFRAESSSGEYRSCQSCPLQENGDRSIELAPRVSTSLVVDRMKYYHDQMDESYQHQIQVIKLDGADLEVNEDERPVVATSSSICNWCARTYNRIHRSIAMFFHHVLNTPYKVQTDVYTWMFLCDFINFLILIYGFWAFGGGYTNQTVTSFLAENRIPFSVLIMLLAQFASIIIDRAFYLQKNIAGKLMFQVVLVIGIHLWLFFALPFTTGDSLALKEYWPPRAWYVFKGFYFLLSAHQIRCGYPRRVLGNCFTKGYGYVNWGAFKVYRAIPLVYDLRLYMDWMWTETTLEFRNWSIMEDMFANLFIRKCELTVEEEYPTARAKPIKRLSKYLYGGVFILLILAIIWGPLLLFSMGKTVGESNPPVEMEYELEFVGFQPILKMRATAQQITFINDIQYDLLKAEFVSLSSQSFLSDYKVGDVAAIRLDGQSNAVWEISPPSKQQLMERIKNNDTLTLKSTWTVYRIKREKSQNFDVSIAGSYQEIISGNSTETIKFRNDLWQMLDSSSNSNTDVGQLKYVDTPPIFPNYLRVPETGLVSLVDQFDDNQFKYEPLRRLRLTYIRVFDPATQMIDSSTSWWKAEDLCKSNITNDSYPFWPDSVLPHCESLVTVTFNDRIFTGLLAVLSAPGIIGLYTTFVVFFARLIRTEPSNKVIYTEIPSVDRVYGLIMDIYMMRECGEFELEEKLFAKLLFLYRSPEMLIEWSKRRDGNYFQELNGRIPE